MGMVTMMGSLADLLPDFGIELSVIEATVAGQHTFVKGVA